MRLRPLPLLLLALSCGSVPEPHFFDAAPTSVSPADAATAADAPAICADLDGDGHPSVACGGDDCDDTNPAIHPGLAELCDGVDNNCNRMIDEAPAGQECQPGQICTGGHCGCPTSGGTGPCAGAGVDAAARIDTSAGADATPVGDADCPPGNAPSPFPGCNSQPGGACDVVCQTGCGCGQHCKLASGVALCSGDGPNDLRLHDSCMPNDDRCAPGLICLQESADHPACGAHCYRHCRGDSDCSGANCSIVVQFGASQTEWKVCSPPTETCNPFGQARCAGTDRAYPTFGCYVLSSSYPDLTVCDCAGTIKTGEACTYEHECEPGAECVLVSGVRACRRTCKVGVVGLPAVGGCPVGMTCMAFPGSSTFGYCH